MRDRPEIKPKVPKLADYTCRKDGGTANVGRLIQEHGVNIKTLQGLYVKLYLGHTFQQLHTGGISIFTGAKVKSIERFIVLTFFHIKKKG